MVGSDNLRSPKFQDTQLRGCQHTDYYNQRSHRDTSEREAALGLPTLIPLFLHFCVNKDCSVVPSLCHGLFQCQSDFYVWCGFILKAVLFMEK